MKGRENILLVVKRFIKRNISVMKIQNTAVNHIIKGQNTALTS